MKTAQSIPIHITILKGRARKVADTLAEFEAGKITHQEFWDRLEYLNGSMEKLFQHVENARKTE